MERATQITDQVGPIGTGRFCRLTKITPPTMRQLEAQGVIHPTKTDTGWRVFSQKDVETALAWKALRGIERYEQNAKRKAEASAR